MRRQHAFTSVLTALVLAAVTTLTAGPASAAKPPGAGGGGGGGSAKYPTSIASLGDSITRGFNAGGWYSDWPSRSWSTGSDSAVVSHHNRLAKLNRKATVRAWNDARTGAKMSELATQAGSAVTQQAQYVTVLMGANDACTSTEAGMTSVATFRAQLDTAMSTLKNQATPPKVLVASIPDIYQLWQVGKNSSSARNAWSSFGICQSMLANPQSTTEADEARRQRVRQRVIDFNAQLHQACTAYGSACKYDGNAVFNYPFKLSHLSTWDYFHPNTSGQAVLADVTWKAGFWPSS